MRIDSLVVRIVPLSELILHEEVDPTRIDQLVCRLRSDGVLKNPAVVTEVGDRFVVLDGATRVAVLRELGIRDVLVQIVDYSAPAVQLRAWSHLIVGMSPDELLLEMERLEGIRLRAVELQFGQRALSLRKILCYLVFRSGAVLAAEGSMDLAAQAALFTNLVGLYKARAEVYRVTTDEMGTLWAEHPDATAVVVFPCYSPEDITRIALDGLRLPQSMTRHMICGRALGLNVNLDVLGSDERLEDKNTWLRSLIETKIADRQVRFYPEPVFNFDE